MATTTAPCIHEMDPATCAICRKAAGYRPGTDRHENDCTVRAFVNLTGADYAEALEYMAAAGRRAGKGCRVDITISALEAAGFTATSSSLTLEQAERDGGDFLVSGRRGNRGHAWTVQAGTQHGGNGWGNRGGTRYLIFRIA
jgi:hypothetical protein